jgi:hypothetical protein
MCGSLHPIGFVFVTVLSLSYLRFAIALGTLCSLISATSLRAILATMGILLYVNLGFLSCCGILRFPSVLPYAGCSPVMVFQSTVSYLDVRLFLETHGESLTANGEGMLMTGALSLLIYGGAAVAVNLVSEAVFDWAVDRPSRPRHGSVRPEH